jgi:hypothetical protein
MDLTQIQLQFRHREQHVIRLQILGHHLKAAQLSLRHQDAMKASQIASRGLHQEP